MINCQKRVIILGVLEFALPNGYPVSDGHPRLLRVQWFLPNTYDFQRWHMQHFLNCAGVVSSLDDLQGDAFVDFHISICGFELVFEFVDGNIVHLFEVFVDFLLHLLVLEKGDERISVFGGGFLFAFLLLFLLDYHERTNFMGSKN
jgi:hypothetical protein